MNVHRTDHSRRSIRLKNYYYSQPGAYFVTICTQNRSCLFGEINEGKMTLNNLGRIVFEEWTRTSNIRHEVELDLFQVMPNHIHGIVVITEHGSGAIDTVGAHGRAPLPHKRPTGLNRAPKSLGSLVAGFKSAATKRINLARNSLGQPVWQRNYYEHIIRDETELDTIRHYTVNNPLNWSQDSLNPLVKR